MITDTRTKVCPLCRNTGKFATMDGSDDTMLIYCSCWRGEMAEKSDAIKFPYPNYGEEVEARGEDYSHARNEDGTYEY